MHKIPIRLETSKDVSKFVGICNSIEEPVSLIDDDGNRVNAKSLLGCLYSSVEWGCIYCICDKDISDRLVEFLK